MMKRNHLKLTSISFKNNEALKQVRKFKTFIQKWVAKGLRQLTRLQVRTEEHFANDTNRKISDFYYKNLIILEPQFFNTVFVVVIAAFSKFWYSILFYFYMYIFLFCAEFIHLIYSSISFNFF